MNTLTKHDISYVVFGHGAYGRNDFNYAPLPNTKFILRPGQAAKVWQSYEIAKGWFGSVKVTCWSPNTAIVVARAYMDDNRYLLRGNVRKPLSKLIVEHHLDAPLDKHSFIRVLKFGPGTTPGLFGVAPCIGSGEIDRDTIMTANEFEELGLQSRLVSERNFVPVLMYEHRDGEPYETLSGTKYLKRAPVPLIMNAVEHFLINERINMNSTEAGQIFQDAFLNWVRTHNVKRLWLAYQNTSGSDNCEQFTEYADRNEDKINPLRHSIDVTKFTGLLPSPDDYMLVNILRTSSI